MAWRIVEDYYFGLGPLSDFVNAIAFHKFDLFLSAGEQDTKGNLLY
jgi:hypothetical protein